MPIVSVKIPDSLDKQLEQLKHTLGVSKSDIIREALRERIPEKLRALREATR
jgi:Arc/MetJ-type ribon-helix-helix transcriptional regulator